MYASPRTAIGCTSVGTGGSPSAKEVQGLISGKFFNFANKKTCFAVHFGTIKMYL
jgi:hypothetical protein